MSDFQDIKEKASIRAIQIKARLAWIMEKMCNFFADSTFPTFVAFVTGAIFGLGFRLAYNYTIMVQFNMGFHRRF
jgi:uncharacterized membrane protein YedE/YeeE